MTSLEPLRSSPLNIRIIRLSISCEQMAKTTSKQDPRKSSGSSELNLPNPTLHCYRHLKRNANIDFNPIKYVKFYDFINPSNSSFSSIRIRYHKRCHNKKPSSISITFAYMYALSYPWKKYPNKNKMKKSFPSVCVGQKHISNYYSFYFDNIYRFDSIIFYRSLLSFSSERSFVVHHLRSIRIELEVFAWFVPSPCKRVNMKFNEIAK